MTRDELIAALEAATGPSRELDEAIAAFNAGATREVQPSGRVAFHKNGFWVSIGEVSPYTSSIDAALSLVPEGYHWAVSWGGAHLWLHIEDMPISESSRLAQHKFPAIALCIAALKARS